MTVKKYGSIKASGNHVPREFHGHLAPYVLEVPFWCRPCLIKPKGGQTAIFGPLVRCPVDYRKVSGLAPADYRN
jgi:hypothetical protein